MISWWVRHFQRLVDIPFFFRLSVILPCQSMLWWLNWFLRINNRSVRMLRFGFKQISQINWKYTIFFAASKFWKYIDCMPSRTNHTFWYVHIPICSDTTLEPSKNCFAWKCRNRFRSLVLGWNHILNIIAYSNRLKEEIRDYVEWCDNIQVQSIW